MSAFLLFLPLTLLQIVRLLLDYEYEEENINHGPHGLFAQNSPFVRAACFSFKTDGKAVKFSLLLFPSCPSCAFVVNSSSFFVRG
jgi:hypothetical protein